MAVFRSEAEVLSEGGRSLGTGMAYLHLPRGTDREQDCTGTVSLQSWEPAEDSPAAVRLEDGRCLEIKVSRDALSDCSRSRILRFTTRWRPAGAGPQGTWQQ